MIARRSQVLNGAARIGPRVLLKAGRALRGENLDAWSANAARRLPNATVHAFEHAVLG